MTDVSMMYRREDYFRRAHAVVETYILDVPPLFKKSQQIQCGTPFWPYVEVKYPQFGITVLGRKRQF